MSTIFEMNSKHISTNEEHKNNENNENITIAHLIALLVYTNFDRIQRNFVKHFSKYQWMKPMNR